VSPRIRLRGAGVLLVALGIARGFGGTLLLLHGSAPDPAIAAAPAVVSGVGWGLVAIGILALVGGVAALLVRPAAVVLGPVAIVAFLIDGALNGWLLFGGPQPVGTALNLAVAALIAGLLVAGRGAIRGA
jgi:hypothetical protein